MERQQAEVRQGVRFIKEELRQPPVPLPQIAADTGSHYVAVGVIAAANLRLHMINRQGGERELHSAVHASMLVAHKDLFAFHDGPVS